MIESEQCTACRLVFWLTHTYLLVTVSDLFNAVSCNIFMGDFRLRFRRGAERREFPHPCTTSLKPFLCLFWQLGLEEWRPGVSCPIFMSTAAFFLLAIWKTQHFVTDTDRNWRIFQTKKYSGKKITKTILRWVIGMLPVRREKNLPLSSLS